MGSTRNNRRRAGTAIIEFALVGSFIFLPIMAGLVSVGISLVAAMQVSNLNSTAGQMFSTGSIDLTKQENYSILLATSSLDVQNGSGLVILTEVDATGGTTPPTLSCTTPISIAIGAGGSQPSKYCPGGVLNSTAFGALGLNLVSGQSVYLAETYYSNPQYNWALAPAGTGEGIYQMAVF